MVVKIFTDGASFNNGYKKENLPQYASGSMIITLNEQVVQKKAYDYGDNTISYAELQTVLYALQYTRRKFEKGKDNILKNMKKVKFFIYSDSEYVVKSFNEYSKKWIQNGFKTSSGQEVAYKDLWKEILEFKKEKRYIIQLIHVKGHQKNEDFLSQMNNLADAEATKLVKEFKEKNNL